jgi:hypothetical protein
MSRAARLAVAAVVLAALLAATLTAGVTTPLPSVALGAVWLLHLERVVAGAVALGVILTLVVRLTAGEVPVKLGAGSLEFDPGGDAVARELLRLVEVEALGARIDDLGRRG